jgi:hypothetical protein
MRTRHALDRGLYDTPRLNRFTGQHSVPDYRQLIDALARRDQSRMLVDGLTAANDLGLTTAVPARVTVHTDTRRRAIQFGALSVQFKLTSRASSIGPVVPRCVWHRRFTG